MLETHEQILTHMKRAKRVLLTCHEHPQADAMASCLALAMTLEKMGIPVDVIVAAPLSKVQHLSFLPGFTRVKHGTSDLTHLVIHVSCKDAKLRDFRYDLQGDELVIHLTPASGSFKPSDVRAEAVEPIYDLIITCDTPDLNTLGELYRQHADFFYRTPIINIDHSAGNELYGQINLVDITAVATTEVIYHLLEAVAEEHLDADIATALLAGMIAKTHSFKTSAVTPRALLVASQLMQRGARRDDIIRDLYRQHRLETLRLWGRVLARLQHDEGASLVWSLIRRDDFQKAGVDDQHLTGVIDEIITNSPQAKNILLLYERGDGSVGGWLRPEPHRNALELTKPWGGDGSPTLASFTIPGISIEDAEQKVRSTLNVRLGAVA